MQNMESFLSRMTLITIIPINFQAELDRIFQTLQLLKDRNNSIASNSQVNHF